MRTTIRIDDELYRAVKQQAARSGRTVGELIEDAVRRSFQQGESPSVEAPRLPTYGSGGLLPGVELTSNAALREAMDADAAVDARR